MRYIGSIIWVSAISSHTRGWRLVKVTNHSFTSIQIRSMSQTFFTSKQFNYHQLQQPFPTIFEILTKKIHRKSYFFSNQIYHSHQQPTTLYAWHRHLRSQFTTMLGLSHSSPQTGHNLIFSWGRKPGRLIFWNHRIGSELQFPRRTNRITGTNDCLSCISWTNHQDTPLSLQATSQPSTTHLSELPEALT